MKNRYEYLIELRKFASAMDKVFEEETLVIWLQDISEAGVSLPYFARSLSQIRKTTQKWWPGMNLGAMVIKTAGELRGKDASLAKAEQETLARRGLRERSGQDRRIALENIRKIQKLLGYANDN